jgi:hypothetical protein
MNVLHFLCKFLLLYILVRRTVLYKKCCFQNEFCENVIKVQKIGEIKLIVGFQNEFCENVIKDIINIILI